MYVPKLAYPNMDYHVPFLKKIAFAAPNMANLSLCKETEDGMILREKYPGGRQPTSVFWAIVQPLVPWWMVLAKL